MEIIFTILSSHTTTEAATIYLKRRDLLFEVESWAGMQVDFGTINSIKCDTSSKELNVTAIKCPNQGKMPSWMRVSLSYAVCVCVYFCVCMHACTCMSVCVVLGIHRHLRSFYLFGCVVYVNCVHMETRGVGFLTWLFSIIFFGQDLSLN